MALSKKLNILERFHNDPKGFCESYSAWGASLPGLNHKDLLSCTREERHKIGFYSYDELKYRYVQPEKVKGLYIRSERDERYEKFNFKAYPNIEILAGQIWLNESDKLPKCRRINGEISVYFTDNKECCISLPSCECINGDIHLYSGTYGKSRFELPNCEKIIGNIQQERNLQVLGFTKCVIPKCKEINGITMRSNSELTMESCETVNSHIYMEYNSVLNLPVCKAIKGEINVDIIKGCPRSTLFIPNCEEITGPVTIEKTDFNAHSCKQINSGLFIKDFRCNIDLSSLERIAGNLEIAKKLDISLPKCQRIEGRVTMHKHSKINLQSCKYIAHAKIQEDHHQLIAPLCINKGITW